MCTRTPNHMYRHFHTLIDNYHTQHSHTTFTHNTDTQPTMPSPEVWYMVVMVQLHSPPPRAVYHNLGKTGTYMCVRVHIK